MVFKSDTQIGVDNESEIAFRALSKHSLNSYWEQKQIWQKSILKFIFIRPGEPGTVLQQVFNGKFVMTLLHHHAGYHCMSDVSQTKGLDDNPSLHKTNVLVILCLPFYALLSCTEQDIGSVTRVRSVVCRADSVGRVLSAFYCNPYKPLVGLSNSTSNFSVSYPGNKQASVLCPSCWPLFKKFL